MDHLARVQVSKEKLDEILADKQAETAHKSTSVYNKWYRKWSGGESHRPERSLFKCNIKRDSGTTDSTSPYFCLWFARGACYKGPECTYLHRIPTESDSEHIDRTTDCFGRLKHAEFREDMAGVGSFLHPSRTLFVGFFKNVPKQQISQQFSEFGEVQSTRTGKGCAFVTFCCELNAEFAREAMLHQTITGREVLVVKWSRSSEVSEEQESEIREIVRNVLAKRKKLAD